MASREITFAEALREALREEMRRDEAVIVMGEDVKINVWAVTRDLYKEFPERVIQTPISESGFTGAAVGAALTGMRPVVEIMYNDFLLYAADSIANQAAKYRYMCGGGQFKRRRERQRGGMPSWTVHGGHLCSFPGTQGRLPLHALRRQGVVEGGHPG